MRSSWALLPGRPVRSLVLGQERPCVPTLVLVPGLGALGYLAPLVQACATWTRVVLLDLPGFGRSWTAQLPADLPTVTQTLTRWLDRVPERPVLLAGHSTGAQVALGAAAAAPGAVRAVAVGGTTFAPGRRTAPAVVADVLRTLPHERPGELPAVLPDYLRAGRRLGQLLGSALQDRPEDVVPALARPLLVLRGRHDGLSPRSWSEQLASSAVDGRAVELPGAHNTPYTHPEQTSEALRDLADRC